MGHPRDNLRAKWIWPSRRLVKLPVAPVKNITFRPKCAKYHKCAKSLKFACALQEIRMNYNSYSPFLQPYTSRRKQGSSS